MAISSDNSQRGTQSGDTEVLDDPLGAMLSDLLEAESEPEEPEWHGIPIEPEPPPAALGPAVVPSPAPSTPPPPSHAEEVEAMFDALYASLHDGTGGKQAIDIASWIAPNPLRDPEPEPDFQLETRPVNGVPHPPVELSPPPPAPPLLEPPAPPVDSAGPLPEIQPEPLPGQLAEAAPDLSGSDALDTLIQEIDSEAAPEFGIELDLDLGPSRKRAVTGDSCIVFSLAGTRYAIPIRSVTEMDAIPRITAVPNLPAFVRGVTNLRGEILAVLDLRRLLGLERSTYEERGRILVVRTADQQSAALAVDEVRGTTALPLAELVQPSSPVSDKVAAVLMGIGEQQDQVLNVLDIDKLFQTPEMRQFTAN